jgi:hypothetical protein
MRYVAMQVLTWGTIAGSIGSALLMASMEDPAPNLAADAPTLATLPSEPTRAGPGGRPAIAASAPGSASAPQPGMR